MKAIGNTLAFIDVKDKSGKIVNQLNEQVSVMIDDSYSYLEIKYNNVTFRDSCRLFPMSQLRSNNWVRWL